MVDHEGLGLAIAARPNREARCPIEQIDQLSQAIEEGRGTPEGRAVDDRDQPRWRAQVRFHGTPWVGEEAWA